MLSIFLYVYIQKGKKTELNVFNPYEKSIGSDYIIMNDH